MGVDTRITLHPDARIRDVARVLGVAAGLPASVHPMDRFPDTLFLDVPGVNVRSLNCPAECADITLAAPEGQTLVDGSESHFVMYHFEWNEGETPGTRGLLPPSTPFWIAAGIKLVDFFGGSIDFNDCDSIDVDHAAPPSIRYASNDPGWSEYQHAMLAVGAITPDDLVAANEHAAYRLAA